jgi:hypothetical protein
MKARFHNTNSKRFYNTKRFGDSEVGAVQIDLI